MARLVISALLLLSVPALASSHVYSLTALVHKVKQDYPAVEAARHSLSAAEAQVSQASRLRLPTGELTFGLTGSPSVRCTDSSGTIPANQAAREMNCIDTSVNDLNHQGGIDALPIHGAAFRLELKLAQPLFTFGKIDSARSLARSGRDVASEQIHLAEATAVENATRAYWGLRGARTAAATIEDAKHHLGDWVRKIDADMDRGKSTFTETDLIRLKLSLETAELLLLDMRRNEEVALAAVRTLTGDPEADVDANDVEAVEVALKPVGFYEDAARLHRPEARMLNAAKSAAAANRSLKLAELLPDIGLVGSFAYGFAQGVDDPVNAFVNHPNTLSLGLYLAIRQPLDFGPRLGRLTQAKAEERQLEAKRREALGGIALEIDRAYAATKEALKRSERTEHGEKLALGWFRSVDDNMKLGIGDSRDLADAARNYFELRLRHLQSMIDFNIAVAALQRAAGIDLSPSN